jgi:long-subunit fatty acid transport protein
MRALLIASLLCPAFALAGGYAIPNPNPREIGLAQATVAAQNGPEAALMNTAALAGQEGLKVTLGLTYVDNKTDWSDPNLGKASTEYQPTTPPALSISYGDKLSNGMPWGVGFGFQVPAGGSLYWPDNWAGAERIQKVDQRGYQLRAGAAIEPIQGIKLGLGGGYWQVTEKLVQQINYVSYTDPVTLGLAGGAPFFTVSAELSYPGIPVTLGFDFKSDAKATLKGNAHFNNPPPTFQPPAIDQSVTEDAHLPNEWFLGLAWKITPDLQLMGSYSHEGWHVYDSDTYVGDKGLVVSVPRNYKDAWNYRAAIEWENVPALKALTLRAGVVRAISDQPTTTIDPSLADASSWVPSIGAGYQVLPSLRVDVAYAYAIFDKVTASGPDAFPGSYKTTAHLLAVGLTWRQKH